MSRRYILLVVLCICATLAGTLIWSPDARSENPTDNLVQNAGFEDGSNHWFVGSGSTGCRDTSHPENCLQVTGEEHHTGSYSAKATMPTVSGVFNPKLIIEQMVVGVEPHATYQFSAWVKHTNSTNARIQLRVEWLSLRQGSEIDRVDARPDAGWQLVQSPTYTAKGDLNFAHVMLYIESVQPGAALEPVYFDDIALTKLASPTPTPTPTPPPPCNTDNPQRAVHGRDRIRINEVMNRADSEMGGNSEWIEFYLDGETPTSLEYWWVDDGPNGAGCFLINQQAPIYPHKYFLLSSKFANLRIDDDAEMIRLFRQDGTLEDELHLPALAPDQSVSRYPDGSDTISTEWNATPDERNGSQGPVEQPTATATAPHTATPQPSASPTETPTTTVEPTARAVSIQEARSLVEGTLVKITGTVTAPPNLLGDKRMYVQDDSAGILVIVPEGLPTFTAGQVVEITGTTDTYYGERTLRMQPDGIRLVQSGKAMEPAEVSTGDIGPGTEGRLVRVHGRITQVSKPNVQLNDGTGEASERTADSTGIRWASPHKDDTITITGIVSSFNGHYRIMPRFEDDLVLERAPEPTPEIREVSIAAARDLPSGTLVSIQGAVTAPPGPLGQEVMYVQDNTSGILITGKLPPFKPGEIVQIEGRIGSYYSELRVDAESTTSLHQFRSVTPKLIDDSAFGSRYEGQLVTIEGTVDGSAWPSLYIGDSQVRVYARASTGIPNPEANKGDTARVTGVVSRWQGKYRLMLRFPSDLTVTHAAVPKEATPSPTKTPEGISWLDTDPTQLRTLPLGTHVRFKAQVTVPSGLLGPSRVYVGTSEAGIALHLPDDGYPTLREGDLVAVNGKLDTYHGELIVRLESGASVRLLGHDQPIRPLRVTVRDIGPSTEGRLVTVTERIEQYSWPAFTIGQDPYATSISVLEYTGIDKPEGGKGDLATVTGVISRWDDHYRLLPRYDTDIEIALAPERDVRETENQPPSNSSEAPELRSVEMSQLRGLPLGTLVRFEGQVTAPPGVLGEERVYMGTVDAGIALRLTSGKYPRLREGDKVTVTGELDTYHGERIVRLDNGSDVSFLSHSTPLKPMRVNASQIGEITEGRLVTVHGQIQQRSWPNLLVGDDYATVSVRVLESTGIPKIEGGSGDTATVTGVVSQWDGKWRLLPRWSSDLQVALAPKVEDPPEIGTPARHTPIWNLFALSQLRGLPPGTLVQFEGQVTALPGLLGKERMYVGTPHDGIALHLTSGDYPRLQEGDQILVRGEMDTYHGERIVRLESGSDVTFVEHLPPLQPMRIEVSQVGPYTEGRLVTFEGKIKQRSWPSLFVSSGSTSAHVRILDSTGIPKLEGGKGDAATVTGIVSRWDDKWRLLPRRTSDLHLVTIPDTPPPTGAGERLRNVTATIHSGQQGHQACGPRTGMEALPLPGQNEMHNPSTGFGITPSRTPASDPLSDPRRSRYRRTDG